MIVLNNELKEVCFFMNFKYIKIVTLFIITLTILVGCSFNNENTKEYSPEEVIENHFEYYNDKNEEKLLSTLTEWYHEPNMEWDFSNLESIKLLNFEEEQDEKQLNTYLTNGRGSINGVSKENVKVFKVKYEVKYKVDGKDGGGPMDSGIYEQWYFVIRENEKSPWLIDSFGY